MRLVGALTFDGGLLRNAGAAQTKRNYLDGSHPVGVTVALQMGGVEGIFKAIAPGDIDLERLPDISHRY